MTLAERPPTRQRPGKRAILRAAVSVIGEHGYEGASMRDIAARAGVSPAAIYYHFPSKHDLLREFLLAAWQQAIERAERELSAEPATPVAQLDRLVASFVRSQHQDEFARLATLVALREIDHLDPVERVGIEYRQRELLALLERVLVDGVATGEFAPVDTAEASIAIFSLTLPTSVPSASRPRTLADHVETAQRLAHRIVGVSPGLHTAETTARRLLAAPTVVRMSTATITLRPVAAPDLDAICALQCRANVHDGIPQVLTIDELHEEIDGERVRYDTDVRIAEIDGELAGYAYTYHLPSDIGQERCYVFGAVDPVHRGRGAGRALLTWGVERGAEQLRSSASGLPKFLRVNAYDGVASAARLFARMGFTPVRWFEELIRPLTDVPPLVPVDGATILPWDASRDEELRLAKNDAFADHWGSAPTSPADWQQMVHGATGMPQLSWFAVDPEGRVIAHCLNQRYESDGELTGRRDAWIANLGTVRAWRGRGLASALIATSLAAFAEAGYTHACIGVDSENPSGAARLYRGLGFEPMLRSATYEIRVDG